MNLASVRKHLRHYSIYQRRASTIHHAFASAIAPGDTFDPDRLGEALELLSQDDPMNLRCVYCDRQAETWDHLYALVQDTRFSGYGHTLGNLVPACRSCNSKKGNKPWREWIESSGASDRRISAIALYAFKYGALTLSEEDVRELAPEQFRRLHRLKDEILERMREADVVAAEIRERVTDSRRPRGA